MGKVDFIRSVDGYAFASNDSGNSVGDSGASGGDSGSDNGNNGADNDSDASNNELNSDNDDGKSSTTDNSNSDIGNSSDPTDNSGQNDDFDVDPQSESTNWSEGRSGKDGNEVSLDSSSNNSNSNSESPQKVIDNSEIIDISYFIERDLESGEELYIVACEGNIIGTVKNVVHHDVEGTFIKLEPGWTITPFTTNEQSNSTYQTPVTTNNKQSNSTSSKPVATNNKQSNTNSSSSNVSGVLTKEAANNYPTSNTSGIEPSTEVEPGIFASHAPVYKVDQFRERINSEFSKIKEIADSTIGSNSSE